MAKKKAGKLPRQGLELTADRCELELSSFRLAFNAILNFQQQEA
ncbi:hypothetical protein PJF56_11135 [Roseofilum sp. BLCC_M91]|uniref:Transposase n=1 Tax=Roseofilum halophilum BLCC-M91 TaxID=3022259 RepID=A0ABT7BLK3_9CYAN|nr:hypothetical protein [Roseofilum halophilum]MDJ1179419.1 hypothetical protein [Roseofilum halophilum BLCC-M91]